MLLTTLKVLKYALLLPALLGLVGFTTVDDINVGVIVCMVVCALSLGGHFGLKLWIKKIKKSRRAKQAPPAPTQSRAKHAAYQYEAARTTPGRLTSRSTTTVA